MFKSYYNNIINLIFIQILQNYYIIKYNNNLKFNIIITIIIRIYILLINYKSADFFKNFIYKVLNLKVLDIYIIVNYLNILTKTTIIVKYKK